MHVGPTSLVGAMSAVPLIPAVRDDTSAGSPVQRACDEGVDRSEFGGRSLIRTSAITTTATVLSAARGMWRCQCFRSRALTSST
jgi:hypothetical protein